MKLICAKNELLKSVNISLKAVSSKTTMPILECILVDASAAEITFTSNDMELGIETKVKGIIEEKGIVALDAKLFSDIIRKLPDSDVTIQTDANLNTTITCEKAKFTIPGKSGDDFAYLPVIERTEGIEISQFTLKEVIRQTIFSIAANENNKLMTGELFEIKDNMLKVVSLDGHRIAIRKIELKDNYPARKVVVPGKTLNEISNLFGATMIQDRLVEILGAKFLCVDEGFGTNNPVDVVIRPEDVELVEPEVGIIKGRVTSVIFKGVHYEMTVMANGFEWLVHSTDMYPVDREVGIFVKPFNIQIMHKPESDDAKAVDINE